MNIKSIGIWGLIISISIVSCKNVNDKTLKAEAEEIVISTTQPKQQTSENHNIPEVDTNRFTTDYIMGKFDPAKHEDFIKLDSKHTSNRTFYLRKDTYKAFKAMYAAALKDGVKLKIISATRNFNVQKSIWEAKWNGSRKLSSGEDASKAYPQPEDRALKILEYSSMPSTSRHHWGTDIDLNALNNKFFESGEGKKIYTWLVENAHEYGFCQPYTEKGDQRPNGYNEERWHWSYMPIARQLTQLAIQKLSNEAIDGFQGSETAPQIDVVKKYVLGINPACK